MAAMSFKNTELAMDMKNLWSKEMNMYELYMMLSENVSDDFLKSRLEMLRKQELGHVRIVQDIIDKLKDQIIE